MSRDIINNIRVHDLDGLLNMNKEFKESVSNKIAISSRKIEQELTMNSVNYGKFIVIDNFRDKESNRRRYLIRFIDTGYEVIVSIAAIRTGNIKDYMRPFVCGVGYLGLNFEYIKTTDKILHKNMYNRWCNMLKRCYDPNTNRYNIYGLKNVSVSKRWHNYSNFYYDTQKLPNYNRQRVLTGDLTLDKDKLQCNIKNKIYSKNTCCWLKPSEQNELIDHDIALDSRRIYFVCTHPDGHQTVEKGIGKFARAHNLDRGDCSRAINGKQKFVKGYKFRLATDTEIDKYKQTLINIE